MSAEITVIHLWSVWANCQKCGEDTMSKMCWPYYEEFLHPDAPNPEGGYVPVCDTCYSKLELTFSVAP